MQRRARAWDGVCGCWGGQEEMTAERREGEMRAQRSRKNVYLSRLNFPRCLQRQGGFIKVLMILGGRSATDEDADATLTPQRSIFPYL